MRHNKKITSTNVEDMTSPDNQANTSLYVVLGQKCTFQGQNYGWKRLLKAYPTVPKKCMELAEILSIQFLKMCAEPDQI